MYIGFLFNPGALWVGAHYSARNKRLCVNILPGCTVFFVRKGGFIPFQQGTDKSGLKRYYSSRKWYGGPYG